MLILSIYFDQNMQWRIILTLILYTRVNLCQEQLLNDLSLQATTCQMYSCIAIWCRSRCVAINGIFDFCQMLLGISWWASIWVLLCELSILLATKQSQKRIKDYFKISGERKEMQKIALLRRFSFWLRSLVLIAFE